MRTIIRTLAITVAMMCITSVYAKSDRQLDSAVINTTEANDSESVPEITGYKTIEFSTEETNISAFSSLSNVIIEGWNDEGYEALLWLEADHILGDFTFENVTPFTLLLTPQESDGVEPFAFSAKVEEVENGYKCTAIFDGYDGIEYTLIFNYQLPAPPPTTMTVTGEMADNTAYEGRIEISAFDDEYDRGIEFVIYTKELKSGEYGPESIECGLGVTVGPIYEHYTYESGVGTLTLGESTFVWSGDFTFVNDETAEKLDYTITITGPLKTGNLYDHDDEGYNAEFSWKNVEIDTEDADNNLIGIGVANDDETKYVQIYFNVAEVDADNIIPLGEYTINKTLQPGTVASTYFPRKLWMINYSFASDVHESGAIMLPCWFMEEGTVLVEEGNEGLYITVNAINTWGQIVTVTIGEKNTTGISNIASKSHGDRNAVNLQGIRINDNYKGIAVKDGKKYLVR